MQDVRRNGRRAVNVDRDRDIGAELVLELEENPFRGLFPDAGNLRETAGLLHGDRLRKLGDRQPGQYGERDPRADAVDLDEPAKRAALVFAAEAVQQRPEGLDQEDGSKVAAAGVGGRRRPGGAHQRTIMGRDEVHGGVRMLCGARAACRRSTVRVQRRVRSGESM